MPSRRKSAPEEAARAPPAPPPAEETLGRVGQAKQPAGAAPPAREPPVMYQELGAEARKFVSVAEAKANFPAYTKGSPKNKTYRCDLPHVVPWASVPVGFCNVPWRTMRRRHCNGQCQLTERTGFTTRTGLSRSDRQRLLRDLSQSKERDKTIERARQPAATPKEPTAAPAKPPVEEPKLNAPALDANNNNLSLALLNAALQQQLLAAQVSAPSALGLGSTDNTDVLALCLRAIAQGALPNSSGPSAEQQQTQLPRPPALL